MLSLLQRCTAARQAGQDFPTIYNAIIKRHPSVLGFPEHSIDGARTVIRVRLMTGQYLQFDGAGFAIA